MAGGRVPPAPTAEQRAQSGGRGWAGRGPLQRGPGSGPRQLILVPGHTQASGLGRGDSRERTPHHGLFHRVTQPQDGPPGGRQWWFVSAESLPAGVWLEGRGGWEWSGWGSPQNLSLFLCTMDSLSGKCMTACGWKEYIGADEGAFWLWMTKPRGAKATRGPNAAQ